MQITKRDNTKETVKLEKITRRINRQSKDLKNVDSIAVAQKVIQGLYDGVTSSELDKLATETAYALSVKHPEYDKLALRLAVSALHKETKSSFSEVIEDLYNNVTDANGNKKSLIDKKVYTFIKKNKHLLDSMIDHDKDFDFDYFGFKTLERSYLWKINDKIVERPQYMWARVSCGIHYQDNDIDACINTYKMLSSKVATHATPTLFNAASTKAQLSSCFRKGTKVFTCNEGNKNIEDVKIGDLVLTHNGTIKRVTQLHKNKLNNRKVYELIISNLNEPPSTIYVTENHKLRSCPYHVINNTSHGIAFTSPNKLSWETVGNLKAGDYISGGFNDYKYIGNNLSIPNPNNISTSSKHKVHNWYINSGNVVPEICKSILGKYEYPLNDEYVYTLGVEDDHSYMVEGIIAENCFLVATKDDSIDGIYDTLKECALISQSAGGIGFYIHQIRSKGSPVYGTGGTSNGIVPALRNFNETARYVDQCLTGDSKILTQNGYKNISDLEINDKVKTLNSFSNIKNKKEFNIDEEIVEIKTYSGSIKVTKNHPVLVVRNCENLSDEQIKQKLLNKLINPEWVEAEKLLVTDRIIQS
jgi:hypothetical protein